MQHFGQRTGVMGKHEVVARNSRNHSQGHQASNIWKQYREHKKLLSIKKDGELSPVVPENAVRRAASVTT
jgi:hypothetical protein